MANANRKSVGRALTSLFFIFLGGWFLSAFAFVLQVQVLQALWWEQIPDLKIGTALVISALLIAWLSVMKVFWQKTILGLAHWVDRG